MGIFQTLVEVINRTSRPLLVRYDGQDSVLQPNYDAEGNFLPDVHNLIPDLTVDYARNQNILMGSEAADDPSDYEMLVGVLAKPGQKQKHDISFLEQSDEPTRVKLGDMLADDQTVKEIKLGGKRNQRRAKHSEAAVPGNVDAVAFRR